MVLENILAAMGVETGSKMWESALEKLDQSDEQITAEELAGMAVLKSYGDLHPELGDSVEASKAFVEDYETLRYAGVPGGEAYEIAQFIYLPRMYLVNSGLLNEEFALNLDEDLIDVIVENGLTLFLDSLGVSKSDDLVFDIAAVEDHLAGSDRVGFD